LLPLIGDKDVGAHVELKVTEITTSYTGQSYRQPTFGI